MRARFVTLRAGRSIGSRLLVHLCGLESYRILGLGVFESLFPSGASHLRKLMRRAPAAASLRGRGWLCFAQFFWLGLSFAGYAWLFERPWSVGELSLREQPAAAATNLFSSLLVGAVLGALLGLLWLGSFGGETPNRVVTRQLQALAEIGRASCRERGEGAGGAGSG